MLKSTVLCIKRIEIGLKISDYVVGKERTIEKRQFFSEEAKPAARKHQLRAIF
jgi:hypothetical protein